MTDAQPFGKTPEFVKTVSLYLREREQCVRPDDELLKRGNELLHRYHVAWTQKDVESLAAYDRALRQFEAEELRSQLLPDHRDLVEASAISPEVAHARGYRTVFRKKELRDLGFGPQQSIVPALLIPIYNTAGQVVSHQIRPSNPRVFRSSGKEKVVKYETPKNSRMHLDVPPTIDRRSLRAPKVPLFVTEGIRKADSAVSHGLCCVALLGVWNWRGTNEYGGKTALPEWHDIALEDRTVYIAFDSDVMVKSEVRKALEDFAGFLAHRKADVRFIFLPTGDGSKTGLDDWLAAGNDVKDLFRLATDTLPAPLASDQEHEDYPYRVDNGRTVFVQKGSNPIGDAIYTPRPVSDFHGRIVEEIVREHGATLLKLEGESRDGTRWTVEIDSDKFEQEQNLAAALTSVVGAHNAIWAGQKKHLAHSIKHFTNGDLRRRSRFERTGWTPDGTFLIPGREAEGVEIDLPKVLAYRVAPAGDPARAVEALGHLLDSMTIEKTGIILSAMFQPTIARRATWAAEKYMAFIRGRTGSLKTSFCQTAMCIWGEDFIRDETLVRWGQGATRNAILNLASTACDLPVLTDNYKSNTGKGSQDFVELVHATMEGGDKLRLQRHGDRLRENRELHGWLISTGEDIPDTDAAALARTLIVPFSWNRTVNLELSAAQAGAKFLPGIGWAWLDWIESDAGREALANQADKYLARRGAWAEWLRARYPKAVNLMRTASNLAANETVWYLLTEHPLFGNVFTERTKAYRAGLAECAATMGEATAESVEASRFLNYLRELVTSRRANLAFVGNAAPYDEADRFIGWEAENGDLYLLPQVTLALLERVYGRDCLGRISLNTIYAQLESLGAIASSAAGRHTVLKRVAPDQIHRVLHLKPIFEDKEER